MTLIQISEPFQAGTAAFGVLRQQELWGTLKLGVAPEKVAGKRALAGYASPDEGRPS